MYIFLIEQFEIHLMYKKMSPNRILQEVATITVKLKMLRLIVITSAIIC